MCVVADEPKPHMGLIAAQVWLREHGIPYVHGCVWDRHCRWVGTPPRVMILWRDHTWWVDLDDLTHPQHTKGK